MQGKGFRTNNVKSKLFKNSQQFGNINGEIRKRVYEIASKQRFMLNIGGDHSVACGSLHGLLEHYSYELRVILVDAHANCNYELDLNRNSHGMPLGHLYGAITEQIKGFEWLKQRLDTKNIIYVGI
ncbi:unnamed protein product (macronuclear) [Paramecium tetraurelia]|uniref:Arginase n=1 Tax=Paramecium tetraurelia TaxID=5888 RepID=A0BR18_PARTE|nr:uncharacterized protein GSPATT00031214001 [Paramecium tetraurelia]CAK60985.1 unnamed protein product [Paramecium tetraurelia]|eukprot:XP_001428383.1 hypothetical protein (macronuclear) [Paramecium tetraurelia strain d4-2]